MDGSDDSYARLVARYSAPQTVNAALEQVKAEARRREKARELVTRARGGVLHNRTVREIARYFRGNDCGRVDLLQVADDTGIPLSDTRQVLREFVVAGLLHEYEEELGDHIRRSYALADGAQGGITEVFVETEAVARQAEGADEKESGWVSGWLRWGRAR
ncbi:hypothetical protein ADZ36_23445 [Streptomyces fradiae]|uniref:Uncharacterized protein n=3 Tax=Streptomyces TaxID=1883 RepID=A0A3R7J202_9ACTN|nr:hypothetical protein ADZ36_23445 [Streptomyces fradiae]OFA40071.1 hypothetical protein BEN35_26160 [Streptomyces fradiae]PQM21637.1 hypothetical protein Sfr7A_21565 [Streptomyces xinghaiensis]RKM94300.1 hypothetical protein SFRA_017510 [Streptomyces xinghaiensis]RNC71900.1 hypothetical protein DC095_019710 [Streptomyces xinghaiensis]